jgi:hypothetical protein
MGGGGLHCFRSFRSIRLVQGSSASPSQMSYQRNQEQHEKNNEQQFCDAGSGNRDASETQNPGDECHQKEH